MKPREFLQVDPASLHLPGSRRDGADPLKLHRQVTKHGTSIDGMPPPVSARHSAHGRGDRGVDFLGRRLADGGRKIMSSAEQIRLELLAALSQLSQIRPEWRLGQTLANLAMTAGRLDAGGVWDLEDEEALAAAKTLIEHYSEVGSVVAELNPAVALPPRQ
jgi:hypothetical protein